MPIDIPHAGCITVRILDITTGKVIMDVGICDDLPKFLNELKRYEVRREVINGMLAIHTILVDTSKPYQPALK